MTKLYLTILAGFCIQAQAQQTDPIQTDRPDQTETPAIVPKGMFQMETGFSYERTDAGSQSVAAPSTLMKYGVNENFELRLIAEFVNNKVDGMGISGLSPIRIGFKAKISEEKGIIPKTSVIAHMAIPRLASDDLRLAYYAPEFRFTMQHTLSDKISLGYNLGAEWDGETPEPAFIYTATAGFSLSEITGLYVECYGFAPQESTADHRFDGGVTYLLSNDFMIDASGGFGITENAPDYFAAVGFSFRL